MSHRRQKKFWHQSKAGLVTGAERCFGDCHGLPEAPAQGDGGAVLQDGRLQHRRRGQTRHSAQTLQTRQ